MQVHAQGPVEDIQGHVQKAVEGTDTGITNEHVNRAKGIHGGLDEYSSLIRVRDITADCNGAATKSFDFYDRAVCSITTIQIVDRDIGLMPRAVYGRRPSDAALGPCDQNGLSFEQQGASGYYERAGRFGLGGLAEALSSRHPSSRLIA